MCSLNASICQETCGDCKWDSFCPRAASLGRAFFQRRTKASGRQHAPPPGRRPLPAAHAAWSGPADGPSTLTSRAVPHGHRAQRRGLCAVAPWWSQSTCRACPPPRALQWVRKAVTRGEGPLPLCAACTPGGGAGREQKDEMNRLVTGDQCWEFTRVTWLTEGGE